MLWKEWWKSSVNNSKEVSMIVELNEKEVEVLKNVLSEAKQQVPTTCTLKFSKAELENSMENLDELSMYGDVDYGSQDYYVFVDNVSIARAKYWYENAYKGNEESWKWSLLSITAEGPRGTRVQILGGDGGPKEPDWTGGVKEKEARYVILGISNKGLKADQDVKISRALDSIGTDIFEYPEGRLICATVPLKGLKNTIAKFNIDYPAFGKRIKVFSDSNLNKDITSKFIEA